MREYVGFSAQVQQLCLVAFLSIDGFMFRIVDVPLYTVVETELKVLTECYVPLMWASLHYDYI